MIIKVSIPEEQTRDIAWQAKNLTYLENLATAHYEGKHFVVPEDKHLFKAISKIEGMSNRASATFNRLSNESSQFNESIAKFSIYCRVVDRNANPDIIEDGGKKIIEVPLTFFSDTSSIQPSIILCENSNESSFYMLLGEHFVRSQISGASPYLLKFEPRHGGGGSIGNEFRKLPKSRIAICIVDSDRKCPSDGVGGTARGIQNSSKEKKAIHEIYFTKVREVENLIPYDALKTIWDYRNRQGLSAIVEWEKAISRLKELEEVVIGGEAWSHLDLKKGMLWKEIFETEDQPCGDYLRKQFKQEMLPKFGLAKKCNQSCKANDKCECLLLFGLGASMLDLVLKMFEFLSESNKSTLLDCQDPSLEERLEIGRRLAAYFLAPKPKRT